MSRSTPSASSETTLPARWGSPLRMRPGLVKVGFAAESQDLVANAQRKIEEKQLDLIVANDITANDAGFAADDNRVVILDAAGGREELPLMPKNDVAWHIMD